MRPLHSVQQRTGFETLEDKKLFTADLMGGAADPTEVSSAFIGTDGFSFDGDQDAFVESLGGQEREDFNMDLSDAVSGIAAIDTNGIRAKASAPRRRPMTK